MIQILAEAERLHAVGFAVHWLRAKSKVPYFGGWTKGPRATLKDLKASYKKGMNYGVRLGHASDLGDSYLAVIDVDVKSLDKRHRKEAEEALVRLFPEVVKGPFTHSGRGNGSAHYYVRIEKPVSGDECKAQSKDMVRVHMPSVPPTDKECKELTFEELEQGFRLRKAWEVSLLSEGRQCVLPGSVHPDTGKLYEWGRAVTDAASIPLIKEIPGSSKSNAEARKAPAKTDGVKTWAFEDVDIDTLDLKQKQIDAIRDGKGVHDASAKVYELTLALLSRGHSDTTIVSIFTDKTYHLGHTSYKHARTTNRRYAAAWVDRYCLRKAKLKVGTSDFDFEEIDEEEPSDDQLNRERNGKPKKVKEAEVVLWPVGLSQPPLAWEKQLELKSRGKLLAPLVRTSYTNISVILQNSCEQANFLCLDQFALNAQYTCDTPWGTKKNQQRSAGTEDALLVKTWLHTKYEMVPPISLIDEILNTVTVCNSYHPVKDYLLPLEWDGVPRIGTALKKYFGARMPEPYLSAVSRKMFIGAVKRIFEPGCTFQYMVVLEGRQGIGKSTAVQILASKRWFLDSLPALHDKDAALYLVGTWLCEVAELTAVLKSDNGVAKGFITRDTDKIRPPYGARKIDYPRSTLFIGTTNLRDYLTDPTGNRRYWPVLCTGVDFEALAADRDQLWAEAVSEYFFGSERLFLEGEALKQAEHIQELARSEDETDIMIEEFRLWEADTIKEDGAIPGMLNLNELFKSVWTNFRADRATMMKAAHALRRMGYEKHRFNKAVLWHKNSLKK